MFGCTDATAANYNVDATYNDGSCEGEATTGLTGIANDTEWSIFPNPVFESTFSVKFDQELILGEENMVIEATDLNGKVVLSHEFTQGDVVGGNRILVKHNLCWHLQQLPCTLTSLLLRLSWSLAKRRFKSIGKGRLRSPFFMP